MFQLDRPFTQAPDGTFRTAAVVGDVLSFNVPDRTGLTVTCTTQPSGSNVTVTDGANGSTTDALTVSGKYTFNITSTLNGFALTARVFVWPAAVIADAGPLVYPNGQVRCNVNKTSDAKRRDILRAIARECSPAAADSLFIATSFPGALTGSAVDALSPYNYGL